MTENESRVLAALGSRHMNVPEIAKESMLTPHEVRKALRSLERLGLTASLGEGTGHRNFRLVTRVNELARRLVDVEYKLMEIERKLARS